MHRESSGLQTKMTSNTNNTLAQRVHTLPVELFRTVYDHTFTCDRQTIVVTRPPQQLPVQFHIDRASREQFAKEHYGKTTFVAYDFVALMVWLEKLPMAEKGFIKRIEFLRRSGWKYISRSSAEREVQRLREFEAFEGIAEGVLFNQCVEHSLIDETTKVWISG